MGESVAFLGLGNLGLPVAANLIEAGYGIHVWNRTVSKAEPLVSKGAVRAETPLEALTPGGIVMTLLWDDASVEGIVGSKGFLDGLGQGGLHISMSTLSPAAGKRLAEVHAKHGQAYAEAPIFGRPEAAVAKLLWVPFAGTAQAKERARPLIEAMGAQGIFDMGETAGAALMTKLVGNFLIVSAGRSLLEGITVAEKYGVDPRKVVEMLTSSLFSAPIYKQYGKMAAEKNMPLTKSPIPAKDLGLIQKTSQEMGVPAPISAFLLDLTERNS